MYKVTLFDANTPSCCSGVVSYFCDDINEFAEKWFELETDEGRKDRFIHSMKGEMVTDYYSDSPDLNIVQEDKTAEIFFTNEFKIRDRWIILYNSYHCGTKLHFDSLDVIVRYVRYAGKLFKLATYSAKGVCAVNQSCFDEEKYCDVVCYGNRVLINQRSHEWLNSDNIDDYKDDTIDFIAYSQIGAFESIESMKEDYETADLSDEDLNLLLCDILGEAG